MARKKPESKGSVIKTETTVYLEGEKVSLSAVEAFVAAVREQAGEGADELGAVTTGSEWDRERLIYTIERTVKENVK